MGERCKVCNFPIIFCWTVIGEGDRFRACQSNALPAIGQPLSFARIASNNIGLGGLKKEKIYNSVPCVATTLSILHLIHTLATCTTGWDLRARFYVRPSGIRHFQTQINSNTHYTIIYIMYDMLFYHSAYYVHSGNTYILFYSK